MKRSCLRCDSVFKSEGNHNRLCGDCFIDINYPEIEITSNANYYANNRESVLLKVKERYRNKVK